MRAVTYRAVQIFLILAPLAVSAQSVEEFYQDKLTETFQKGLEVSECKSLPSKSSSVITYQNKPNQKPIEATITVDKAARTIHVKENNVSTDIVSSSSISFKTGELETSSASARSSKGGKIFTRQSLKNILGFQEVYEDIKRSLQTMKHTRNETKSKKQSESTFLCGLKILESIEE